MFFFLRVKVWISFVGPTKTLKNYDSLSDLRRQPTMIRFKSLMWMKIPCFVYFGDLNHLDHRDVGDPYHGLFDSGTFGRQ